MTTIEHVTLTVTLDTGNAGVTDEPYEAAAAILEDAAARIRDHRTSGTLRDVNGNGVGDYALVQTVAEDAAPTGPRARCAECGRVFDLADEDDAAEWSYGHDCEDV